jgi:hypothetical protein
LTDRESRDGRKLVEDGADEGRKRRRDGDSEKSVGSDPSQGQKHGQLVSSTDIELLGADQIGQESEDTGERVGEHEGVVSQHFKLVPRVEVAARQPVEVEFQNFQIAVQSIGVANVEPVPKHLPAKQD